MREPEAERQRFWVSSRAQQRRRLISSEHAPESVVPESNGAVGSRACFPRNWPAWAAPLAPRAQSHHVTNHRLTSKKPQTAQSFQTAAAFIIPCGIFTASRNAPQRFSTQSIPRTLHASDRPHRHDAPPAWNAARPVLHFVIPLAASKISPGERDRLWRCTWAKLTILVRPSQISFEQVTLLRAWGRVQGRECVVEPRHFTAPYAPKHRAVDPDPDPDACNSRSSPLTIFATGSAT